VNIGRIDFITKELTMARRKGNPKYKKVQKRVKCPKCKGKKTKLVTVYKLKNRKWGGNKGDMSKSRRDYSKRRK